MHYGITNAGFLLGVRKNISQSAGWKTEWVFLACFWRGMAVETLINLDKGAWFFCFVFCFIVFL